MADMLSLEMESDEKEAKMRLFGENKEHVVWPGDFNQRYQ